MDFGFDRVLIAAGVLAVQFFFSTRNRAYWGAVIPVAYAACLTWMFATNQIESALQYALILLIGLLFLFGEWRSGRIYYHKKRKKELEKMKATDLKFD
ncbi:MAG: hypothetical protein C6W55_00690 [Thermobacillus sp.]|jgi:hypothetical protein|uniref:Uncharacterized protein n=2 Tax=Thermobacillus TaxID=76632 RepID=L0EFY9_THECK|nr:MULTISPECIES: hypothetical protein [Thermobacillus]AGA58544.1 hypothetical protein Theco_2436 [Thermobacillus composti KWC4]REJ15208.1 MAG: hypothetical protein C6W59_09340 [Paenibacillaceae bacterium]REK59872.1 MAG: hypothetical protein C6W55_00690 [Thermobacillus sp.]CAG5090379.1 Putative uncharacterized protein [Thermobacillus xylanilyticus]